MELHIHALKALLFLLLLVLYFLPSFAARGKDNFNGVLMLNFLLGWTVLCWMIALVWAYMGKSERA